MYIALVLLVASFSASARHQEQVVAQLHDAGVFVQLSCVQDRGLKQSGFRYPDWLENMTGQNFLYSVDAVCLVSDDNPHRAIELIASLPGLRLMKLPHCRAVDADVALLGRCERLEWLELWGTDITDKCMTDISALKSLRILDLRDTGISDASVEQLSRLRELELLLVRGSKLTPVGITRIQDSLPRCTIDITR